MWTNGVSHAFFSKSAVDSVVDGGEKGLKNFPSMVMHATLLTIALISTVVSSPSNAFVSPVPSFLRPSPSSGIQKQQTPHRQADSPIPLSSLPDIIDLTSNSPLTDLPKVSSLLLSYSDDPLGDIIATINVPILGATIAGIAAVGLSFARLLPSLGAEAFVLTPEEEAACVSVSNAFDSADWEKEEVEEGTKGYINRRRQANEVRRRVSNSIRRKSLVPATSFYWHQQRTSTSNTDALTQPSPRLASLSHRNTPLSSFALATSRRRRNTRKERRRGRSRIGA